MQLLNGVLMLSKLGKVSTGKGALARLEQDGTVRWDVVEYTAKELENHAKWLFETSMRIESAREKPAELELNTGPHCLGCPSFIHCPAQQKQLAVVAKYVEGLDVLHDDWVLDENTAPQVYVRVMQIQRALDSMLDALKVFASETPLNLPGGGTWGQHKESHFTISNHEGAAEYLLANLGEHAKLAINVKVTRGGIKEAVKAAPRAGTLKDAQGKLEQGLIEGGLAGFADVYKYTTKGVPKGRKALAGLYDSPRISPSLEDEP